MRLQRVDPALLIVKAAPTPEPIKVGEDKSVGAGRRFIMRKCVCGFRAATRPFRLHVCDMQRRLDLLDAASFENLRQLLNVKLPPIK